MAEAASGQGELPPQQPGTENGGEGGKGDIAPPVNNKKQNKKSLYKILKYMIKGKDKTPEQLEKERIIKKQKLIELFEINEDLKFVFGNEKPKKKKDCLLIKNVTLRRIWMEQGFIFDAIKAHEPEKVYWPVEEYTLRWKPPSSPFQMLLPLTNPVILEQAIRQYSFMTPRRKALTIFYFAPMDIAKPMFRENVHPASLVEFKTKATVLDKLCSLFLDGKIDVNDLNNVMECGYDTWKVSLFNYLPDDWQPYHLYLSASMAKESKKSLEKRYVDDEITLEEYHGLKFPERKRLADLAAASYPIPYKISTCIICSGENGEGVIKCQKCDNQVCRSCVTNVFLDSKTREGSFLMMHRRYCLRLGRLPNVMAAPVPEPAYLRILRRTGQVEALKNLPLPPPPKEEETKKIEEKEEEEDPDERTKRIEEERNAILPEVMDLQFEFGHRQRKLKHLRKDLVEFQSKIDEGSAHSDQYIERIHRLLKEEQPKVSKVKRHFDQLLGSVSLLREQVNTDMSEALAQPEDANAEGDPFSDDVKEMTPKAKNVELTRRRLNGADQLETDVRAEIRIAMALLSMPSSVAQFEDDAGFNDFI